MGVEKEMKMAEAMRKLNRVIHRSTLSANFVSLFFAEIESTGNVFYVNAGHPPPILVHDEIPIRTRELLTSVNAHPRYGLEKLKLGRALPQDSAREVSMSKINADNRRQQLRRQPHSERHRKEKGIQYRTRQIDVDGEDGDDHYERHLHQEITKSPDAALEVRFLWPDF